MKIGIVCYPTFGGSGVVATELGKALALKGHEIHFITYRQPVRLDVFLANIFYHEVTIKDYSLFDYAPYELNLVSKMVSVIKKEKLDLLHVHYAIPHASAAYTTKQILAAEGIHIPFITTLHGTDITLLGKDPSFLPAITFSINQSDAVTAVSESLKRETYEYFKITKDIHVIPNFIDVDLYSHTPEECQKNNYAPNGEKILTHISNFRKVKRIDDVIRIFESVQKQINAKLLMVGDGPEREVAEGMVEEMGIRDKVLFLGKITSPERILCISDLFLLPSETESFGLAALEAMAAGVPVISSNTGGIPEVNIHNITGMLSNVGDVYDMAKNCVIVLRDEAKMALMKKNARIQAEKFKIEYILPMYEELYQEVVKGKLANAIIS
jgi:L-malate glycosyltransferase